MLDDAPPEADALDGYSHPRLTPHVFGQDHAKTSLLTSWQSGRMHHGLLLTGPKGIGKATFAWQAARMILLDATAWETNPEDPLNRRISALSEQRIALIRRQWDDKAKRHKTQISVDNMRGLRDFFSFAATDGGWRVAIIDAADEMNIAASNALLKVLEEPPRKTVILLVAHQPSRLLPTIRSRCMTLPLSPLSAPDMEAALRQQGVMIDPSLGSLTDLANGSVGQALRLMEAGGPDIYAGLITAFTAAPANREAILKLAEACVGATNAMRYEMTIDLFAIFLARLARQGAAPQAALQELAPGEARVLNRLAPNPYKARHWAELAITLPAKARAGRAVNLDPSSVILDMALEIDKAAGQ